MIPLQRMPRRPSVYLCIILLALVVIFHSVDPSARPNAARGAHIEDVKNDTLGVSKGRKTVKSRESCTN